MYEPTNKENDVQTYSNGRIPRVKTYNQVWTGLFVILIGAVLLMRQSGIDFPFWFFSWPMALIALGILGAIKHNFRPGGWYVLLAVGGVFLADRLIPGMSIQSFAWPCFIIVAGLWMILKPKTHHKHFDRRRERNSAKEWRSDSKKEIYAGNERYKSFDDSSD